MIEFMPRRCPICDDPKNEMVDGREFILRCLCDWERGFEERLKSTVHSEFWMQKKKLNDWSPRIFKGGGDSSSVFKSLIKIQKANAIFKLNDFYFKNSTFEGKSVPQLVKSINYGKNLFIRGPVNSGRGLLVACIKAFAAVKEMSATKLPGEWSTFKAELVESENFGTIGADAKTRIAENYRNVQLMTIENLRSENRNSIFEDKYQVKKFRGATAFDELLTRRLSSKGAMVFSSSDFAGQIGESLGDRLPEVLGSEKTDIILMVDPKEANLLLTGLGARWAKLAASCITVSGLKSNDSKKVTERNSENDELENVKYALYMADLFKMIPTQVAITPRNTIRSFLDAISDKALSVKVLNVYNEFVEDKKENGMRYQDNVLRTYALAAQECKEFKGKLTERECIEMGRLMCLACGTPDDINAIIQKALNMRDEMSGGKK